MYIYDIIYSKLKIDIDNARKKQELSCSIQYGQKPYSRGRKNEQQHHKVNKTIVTLPTNISYAYFRYFIVICFYYLGYFISMFF